MSDEENNERVREVIRELNMRSEEYKKVCDAIELIAAAIRKLSENTPRHADNPAFPAMRVTSAWFLLDEACKKLGLRTSGNPT